MRRCAGSPTAWISVRTQSGSSTARRGAATAAGAPLGVQFSTAIARGTVVAPRRHQEHLNQIRAALGLPLVRWDREELWKDIELRKKLPGSRH